MADWIGKTIGKVRIEKYLAQGGMAEVYLGSHLSLDRPVAVKVLHSHVEEDPDLLARFHREAKVVAGLRHPNIVYVFDFDTYEGHPYIVMEYLKGPTLSTYLRGLHNRDQRIPTHQVARLLKALTAALDYAHGQGVIHRDIKPGNIMLHGKADEVPLDEPLTGDVEAVLTDFGLVRIEHAASQTASGIVSGTPSYMSPEQARGDKTDYRTDIYSLGVVLYEMLAGRVPFEADSSMTVLYMHINEPPPPIEGVSPEIQAVLNRALAKNPNDRYQSCHEMAAEFFLALGMSAEAETIYNAAAPQTSKPSEALEISDGTSNPTIVASIEPKPPRRTFIWIGAAILAFLVLAALVVGALGVFSILPASSAARGTQSPTGSDPTITITSAPAPTPTATLGLPGAEGMVNIPSGTYEVGINPADDYHNAQTNMTLTAFWIDRYQTTNSQYEQYLNATGSETPEVWPGEAKHPVRGVTWDQAAAYCSWTGKRLPTEAEWEAAGRGPGASPQIYPWGNDPTAGGKTISLPDQDTYEVGSQSFNESLSGVFDMVGNVWEWVGKPYGSAQDGYRILRGGRYGLPQDLAYRLAVAVDDHKYVKFAGFRCAADQVR
jgi:serine/threonine protein kinase